MSNILFHPLAEGGHIIPTLEIARKLKARGDRVFYLVEVVMQDRLEAEGFEVIPYLEQEYPHGSVFSATLEEFLERHTAQWTEFASGWIAQTFASLDLDLILYDVCRVEAGLVAHQMGIPCVRVSTSFPAGQDPAVPPLWSDALPGEMSAVDHLREWNIHRAATPPWLGSGGVPGTMDFFQAIDACSLELGQVSLGCMGLMIDGDPELVTSSSLLDFPETSHEEGRFYAGPCLSPAPDEEWTWPERRADAPLVYCSFGGQSANYPKVKSLVRSLMETCAARQDIDMVLAVAPALIEGLELPQNVHFMKWAPQRQLLREADLFITHGGQGSLKEAMWEGTPLLVCPQAYDQHGNAARVVYHKLGLRMLEEAPSPETLDRMIGALLTDDSFKARAGEMATALRSECREDLAIAYLDRVVKGPANSMPHRYLEIADQMAKNALGYLPKSGTRLWHQRTWDIAWKAAFVKKPRAVSKQSDS